MDINDIETVFMIVSHDSPLGENYAMICKSTGQIHYATDDDEIDEIPEEAYESDDWVAIPHRNDLDLGRKLVFEFVERKMPSEIDRVSYFFNRRGAYARYKDLLDENGLLKEWYDFENERERRAILEWCRENGIEITE